MAARAVGVAAAGFALAANAFMIPSTTVLDAETSEQLERVHMPDMQPTRVVLDLPCPDCGSAKDASNQALRLDFALSDDRQTLNLWDSPFYPHPRELKALTTAADRFDVDRSEAPRPIFYHNAVSNIEAADGSDAELIDIDFHITGVEETDITVDKISLRLLRDEEGNLVIADVVRVPADGSGAEAFFGDFIDDDEDLPEHEFNILPIDPDVPPHHLTGSRPGPHDDEELKKAHEHEQPECRGPAMLCRLKSIIDSKIGMMRETIEKQMAGHGPRPHGSKPCPGMMARPTQSVDSVPLKGGPAKFWGMDHPHPHHRGGRHGHRHHPHGPMHRFAHALQRLFFGFALPVMIGVAAGMTASVLGMIVGTCIAWLWIKLVRGGRRGNASRAAAVSSASAQEAGEASEKAGLMSESAEDEEPLPVYAEKS